MYINDTFNGMSLDFLAQNLQHMILMFDIGPTLGMQALQLENFLTIM